MAKGPCRTRVVLSALAVCASLLALLCQAAPVGAAENEGWAVFPTNSSGGTQRNQFVVDLVPGVTVNDSVTITNKTDRAITFRVYGADAYNTESGAYSLRLDDAPKEDLGAWIQLSAQQVAVGPGASVDVPFSIVVPSNATPGDHAGGIVTVDPTGTVQEGGDVGLNVVQAVGVRIYGRVAGPLAPGTQITRLDLATETGPATLLGASYDATVTYTVTNTGNVRLTPTVVGSVSGFLSSEDIPITELPELLPGGSATVIAKVGGLRPTGSVTAEITVTAPGTDPLTRDASAWVAPWLLLLLGAVAVLVVIVLLVRRRRSSPPAAPSSDDGPRDSDDLVDAGAQ